MHNYYKSLDGIIYRLEKTGFDFESNRKVSILQKMADECGYYVTDYHLNEGFTPIPENEAIALIPLWLNPKYHFPDIDYKPEMPPLQDSNNFSPRVKAMKTLLENRGIVKRSLFEGLSNDDKLEKKVIDSIHDYNGSDSPEEIFHMIQTWGGSSSRGIYIFEDQFSWDKIEPHYKSLIETCLQPHDTSDSSIDSLVDLVKTFNKSVSHLGVSFITKHVRFWLSKEMGENALPIFDSIMAMEIMRQNSVNVNNLGEYWKVMVSFSKHHNIKLMPLERQIFKYALGK